MKSVRIYKNQLTNQIYLDNKKTETILTKYTEDDYIFIAKLICFIKKPENMELNICDIDDENCINGLLSFSYKTQAWIKTEPEKAIKSYFSDNKPNDSSKKGYINLIDFKYINKPSISSSHDFQQIINTFTKENLEKLKEFGLSYGFITKNLLEISDTYDIDLDSGIIKKIFNDISKQFLIDNPEIYFRSKEYYEIWRNKLIKLSVDNIELNRINRDFLSFILLHIFELACSKSKIKIVNLKEIDFVDGKKKKRRSKRKIKRKNKSKHRKSRN